VKIQVEYVVKWRQKDGQMDTISYPGTARAEAVTLARILARRPLIEPGSVELVLKRTTTVKLSWQEDGSQEVIREVL